MITTSNLNEARKMIQSSKEKPLIVKAQSLEFDRTILEYGKFDILLSIEANAKKDHPKYLDSGLNHIIAKIAAKNKIAIGIDINSLQSLERKQKAQRLSRIKQNIKVCRKANCKIIALNYEDKGNTFEFLKSLGASTKQAKEATN